MKEQIKQVFEIEPRSIIGNTLEKIHKERIRRWKMLSVMLVFSNLVAVSFFLTMPKSEYKPMSAGVEVRVSENLNFGELEAFLKQHELTISGPSQRGSFLIEGRVDQKKLEELVKSFKGLTPEDL
ncbi:MAG: hypothetical protein NZL90_05510 [Aquificaceae bacterium]|nr:hypothetical protein [Aquificaceae bacterium]